MLDVAISNATATEPSMADLAGLRTDRTPTAVSWDSSHLTLNWDDGRHTTFAALWLRDNCACPKCRHPQALERTFMFIDHAEPSITQATLLPGHVLEVQFSAGGESHVSQYAKGWLRAHDLAELAMRAQRYRRRTWDRTIRDRLTQVSFADYMHGGGALRTWLEALKTDGIVLLREVPQESGKLVEVARRIGPIRASNFGEYYDVVSMPKPNASAYTPMGLELHTDLANWRSPPDVQLLSCLKSSVRGGESVFADGFCVAEALRAKDRRAFEVLATQPVEFRFHDESCDIRHTGPVLEIDRDGTLTRVRFNNWLRGTLDNTSDRVAPFYAALGQFWQLLRDPQYRLELRHEPGHLITYDNNRVLHGRAPFDPSTGERHLQGCYLNLENVDSTLRLLDRAQA
jgi:gamma-butyrobetaine dioxygenase